MIAIDELYDQYAPQLVGWFINKGNGAIDPATAEDLTHDVFERALRHLSTYEDRGTPRAWLFMIAQNILYDRYRRASANRGAANPVNATSLEDITEDIHPASLDYEVEGTHARLDVVQAAEVLPDTQFETLQLRVHHDLTLEEVAAVQGCTEDAVKKKLARAREHLRKLLRDDYNTTGRFGGAVSLPPFPKPQAHAA